MHSENPNENHLVPIAAAGVAYLASNPQTLEKLKKLGATVAKVKNLGAKFGVGGVKDDRFIATRDKVRTMFKNAGYDVSTPKDNFSGYYEFGITHKQIPNRKTTSYTGEYAKLYTYTVSMLNKNNPGLGDLFKTYVPGFPMANKGGMIREPLEILEIFITSFPPKTYKPGMLPTIAENKSDISGESLTPKSVEPDPIVQPGQSVAGINLDVMTPMGIITMLILLGLIFAVIKNK